MSDTNPELQAMSLPELLAQTVDCRNGHHSWTERGHGPCSACGEPSPPPVMPQLECGCLQGACHGGHTRNVGVRMTDEELRRALEDCNATEDWTSIDEDVADLREWFTELLALRAYATDHEGRCDTLCPRCGIDIGLKRCDACGRPRFSDRHLAQVTRDRDRANVVLAHIVESLDADEDLAWEHLPDMVRDLRTQQDRVTDLFETWAAEENEHRLANEFGIAEGLKVAIEGLREAVHGTEGQANG